MSILVVGATGATGSLLVEELLRRGKNVQIIVRTPERLPARLRDQQNLSVIQANLLDLTEAELARHVEGCEAVASCLGHNITFRGVFGPPYRLVTEATRRLCRAIESRQTQHPTKFVLMNTSGNSNRDLDEQISLAQQCVIGIIRLLIPPHADNEQAADFLRTRVGQTHATIEWAAVRPDGLVNETEVSPYEIHPSPTRSAIFDAGTVSRINVAHFMAELITDNATWEKWKGQMPVIYSKSPEQS